MSPHEERSVSEILQDILGNLQEIVHSQIRLANADFRTKAENMAKAARPLIAGVVLSLYAGGVLLVALVLGLSKVLPSWMAALSAGVVGSLLAAILIAFGWDRLRKIKLKPEIAIGNMKEDVQWLKDQTS